MVGAVDLVAIAAAVLVLIQTLRTALPAALTAVEEGVATHRPPTVERITVALAVVEL